MTKKEYDELPTLQYGDYKTPGLYKLPGGNFEPPLYRIFEVLQEETTIVQRILEIKNEKPNGLSR
jgi:hypothetical protein